MINVYPSNEKNFVDNGLKILKPLKASIRKEDNGDYYLDLKDSVENIDYYQAGMLIRVDTPWGKQAFRLSNPKIENNKVISKAKHVYFDSKQYLIKDSYVVNKNCNDALDHLNSACDTQTPFTFISDILEENSYRCVRQTLESAINEVINRWGGHLERDNYSIGVRKHIGMDRGVTISYLKNIKKIKADENWDNVVTKIMPVGKDGLLLPEIYLSLSEILYDIPYTAIIQIDQSDIMEEDYTINGELDNESYNEALINDLRKKGNDYLEKNKLPKVNYSIDAYINDIADIGDTIYVKHPKCNIDLITNVIALEYDCILKKYTKIEFGNFKNQLKNLITDITSKVEDVVKKNNNDTYASLEKELNEATNQIKSVLGDSNCIYEGDKILIVDKLPKEQAKFVMMINSGGIGFSNTGINGTFNSAWTIDGTLNMQNINVINLTADLIKGGILKLGGQNNTNGTIEIYDENQNLVGTISKEGIKFFSSEKPNGFTIEDLTNSISAEIDAVDGRVEINTTQIGDRTTKSTSLTEDVDGLSVRVENIQDQSETIAQMNIKIDEINASIENIQDITISDNKIGTAEIDNVLKSEIIHLEIYPTSEDLSYIYASNDLYPSDDLFLLSRDLIFTEKTTGDIIRYTIPTDLNYIDDNIKDEFILDYDTEKCYAVKRVGIDASGNKYALSSAETIYFEYPLLALETGSYTVKMLSFDTANIYIRALANNIYTSQNVTQVQLKTEISLLGNQLNLEVSQKLDSEYFTGANIMLAINNDESLTQINADKINLNGKVINLTSDNITINSTNFNVDSNGNATMNNLIATNGKFTGEINATSGTFNGVINASSGTFNGKVTSSEGSIGGWGINSEGFSNGTWYINKNGYTNVYTFVDIIILRNYLLEVLTIDSNRAKARYDLNNDGVVNSADLLILQNMILGS